MSTTETADRWSPDHPDAPRYAAVVRAVRRALGTLPDPDAPPGHATGPSNVTATETAVTVTVPDDTPAGRNLHRPRTPADRAAYLDAAAHSLDAAAIVYTRTAHALTVDVDDNPHVS